MKSKCYVAMVVMFILMIAGMFLFYYYRHRNIDVRLSKIMAGVCLSKSRVLSSDDLMKNFRRSFVTESINRVKRLNVGVGRGMHRLAVIYGRRNIDYHARIIGSANGLKLFGKNFGAVIIYDGLHDPRYGRLDPSRPLMSLSIIDGGGAWTWFDDLRDPIFLKGNVEWYRKHLDESERLAGFGYYFVAVTSIGIPTNCCNKRQGGDTKKRNITLRRDALAEALRLIRTRKSKGVRIYPISTCGDVLVKPSSMGGVPIIESFRHHKNEG